MKASAVWLLGVVLVPFWALAQAPANLNTITSVQVNGGTVTITGSKKANFTTFTMTDPPRLVIDISEAVFSNVPEETPVGNGTVTGIRTASYGSDESAIARVLIGYEREVETDIQATDSQLVIKVVGGAGQAVAQSPAAAEKPTTDGSAAQAAARAEADRQAQEKATAEASARAEADRQAQEKAAAEATARAQADAEAEKERQRQRDADARAEEQRSAQAAADDRKRQEEEARASAQAAADERKRQEEEARASAQAAEDERRASAQAAADQKKREQEDSRSAAKTAAEEKRAAAQAAEEERRASAQAAKEEKRAAAQAAKDEAAEARRQREEEARAERERRQQERLAMATPRERREVASGGGAAEVSSRRKTMTLVGFQQQPGTSRVFIQTNEPARYTVSEQGSAVVLELENSRIDLSNNTRPLDTSYFNSPVTKVEADADGRNVRVTIQLRQNAPVQARQDGNVISLDFQRTAR
ncbi:AMIN domain-containing protein [Myxococcus landrumensis]|uniref:AMIN domain-containing protein n=1 Tax=Myxococcus landrumensis TaxID=2813577 RepID=A0ABX7NDR4_9BACT|nr:AMIN domain-containing protein [Myxococcus landrumus]QSQ16509.1 AMIN domain-containing protein [Myxococcus landrumus]